MGAADTAAAAADETDEVGSYLSITIVMRVMVNVRISSINCVIPSYIFTQISTVLDSGERHDGRG